MFTVFFLIKCRQLCVIFQYQPLYKMLKLFQQKLGMQIKKERKKCIETMKSRQYANLYISLASTPFGCAFKKKGFMIQNYNIICKLLLLQFHVSRLFCMRSGSIR